MDDNLQQHYAELQRLTDSVKKGWWSGTEKNDTINYLGTAIAVDPNLNALNPTNPDFLDDLSLTLQALLLNKSEIPANNQPPQNVINDQKKGQFLKKLDHLQQKVPVAFRDAKGKPAGFSQEETYLSLKKYGVIDDQGNFNLNNTVAKQRAEREITKNFVRQYHRQSLENELELSLVTEAPVGLFQSEFFGKGQIPGVVQTIAASLSEKTSEYLLAIMEGRLGGAIDMNAPNFQTALDKAIVEVRSANRFGSLLSKTEIQGVITAYLRDSPSFNRLAPNQQDILIQGAAAAILNGAKRTETPDAIHKPEIVQNPSGEISLKITSASYQTSRRGLTNFQALPTLPKNIGEKVVQGVEQVVKSDFNSGTNIVATKKLQDFWEGLAADPMSAILHYPVNSLLHLLPRPLQNWYFKQTGTQDAWKELQKKYFYATSPEGLRLFTQDMVYRGAKAALRPLGITNDKGQWVWASTLGWVTNKATTNVGEGLASLTSHIPLIGGVLSKTFKRRLGNGKKQDEELLTSVLGIFLDIGVGALKFLPGIVWQRINQIPAVKQFRIDLTQKYFALENSPRVGSLLRTIRTVGGVTSSYVRGIFSLNTLAGGGLGNIIGTAIFGPAGTVAGTIVGTVFGALYQGWFNIAKNGGLVQFLNLPGGNFIDKFYKLRVVSGPGVFMAEHGWARIPLKGGFVSAILWRAGVPGPIAAIPAVWDLIWETRDWWGRILTTRIPLLGRIGKFFSWLGTKFGKFFSGLGNLINPGLFLGWQLFPQLGLNALLGAAVGSGGWLVLLKGLGLGAFSGAGWFGWFTGEAFSFFFHLAPAQALFVQTLSSLGGLAIARFGLGTLVSLLYGAIAPLVGSLVTAISGGLTALAAIAGMSVAGVLALIAGIVIVITITTASAFVIFSNLKAITAPSISDCFAPTKTVVIIDKATGQPKPKAEAGDTLRYQISLGARKAEIKNTVVKDDFRESEVTLKGTEQLYVTAKTFTVSQEPVAHKGPLPNFDRQGAGGQSQSGPREWWQRVTWENFTATPTTAEITYEVKVADKYTEGAIINLLMVDGEWLDPQGKKGNCQVTFTTSVNSGATEAKGLAETIIRELKNCGMTAIDSYNWSNAQICLVNAKIPPAAIAELKKSVSVFTRIQCVGFINAVEAATGGNLTNISLANAKAYWRALVGYQQIYKSASTLSSLQPGDILIWISGADGHMAIVVTPVFDPDGKLAKIVIAEAMGDTGAVRLREISPDDPGLAGWQRRK